MFLSVTDSVFIVDAWKTIVEEGTRNRENEKKSLFIVFTIIIICVNTIIYQRHDVFRSDSLRFVKKDSLGVFFWRFTEDFFQDMMISDKRFAFKLNFTTWNFRKKIKSLHSFNQFQHFLFYYFNITKHKFLLKSFRIPKSSTSLFETLQSAL